MFLRHLMLIIYVYSNRGLNSYNIRCRNWFPRTKFNVVHNSSKHDPWICQCHSEDHTKHSRTTLESSMSQRKKKKITDARWTRQLQAISNSHEIPCTSSRVSVDLEQSHSSSVCKNVFGFYRDLLDDKSRRVRKNRWGYIGGCSVSAWDVFRESICMSRSYCKYIRKGQQRIWIDLFKLLLQSKKWEQFFVVLSNGFLFLFSHMQTYLFHE